MESSINYILGVTILRTLKLAKVVNAQRQPDLRQQLPQSYEWTHTSQTFCLFLLIIHVHCWTLLPLPPPVLLLVVQEKLQVFFLFLHLGQGNLCLLEELLAECECSSCPCLCRFRAWRWYVQVRLFGGCGYRQSQQQGNCSCCTTGSPELIDPAMVYEPAEVIE